MGLDKQVFVKGVAFSSRESRSNDMEAEENSARMAVKVRLTHALTPF